MRAYLGGLLTYNLEAILKYRRRSSYDLRTRSRLQVHRGRDSYDLFSPTRCGARAYVGDLPMTDDLEVIWKYCGRSSYDLRSRSHLQVLWGIFLGLDPGLPLEVVLEPPLANLRLSRGLCGRSRAALVASPGGLGRSWEPMCGQERPKSSQERPKSAPKSGQERPKSSQEPPKSSQERPKSDPRAARSDTRAV